LTVLRGGNFVIAVFLTEAWTGWPSAPGPDRQWGWIMAHNKERGDEWISVPVCGSLFQGEGKRLVLILDGFVKEPLGHVLWVCLHDDDATVHFKTRRWSVHELLIDMWCVSIIA